MGRQCILGIDVGTSAVKVLATLVSPDRSVQVIGSGVVPARGLEKGNIKDMLALISTVRDAVDCAQMAVGVPIKEAYIGLGGSFLHSHTNVGSVAPASRAGITREDILRACQAAALPVVPEDYKILHLLPGNLWVDGDLQLEEPVGKTGLRLEAETHISIMPQGMYNEFVELLNNAGIPVSGIYANSVAGGMYVPHRLAKSYLYLDIGAGVTDILLRQDGNILYSASLPLGGDYITNDIMQGLEVGWAHAEEIKRYYTKLDKEALQGQDISLDGKDYGAKNKKVAFDFLYEVVESRIKEIAALLHGYIMQQLSASLPETVLLTGGCAHMPSVQTELEAVFGLPVRTVRPGVAREYASPANSACFGLLSYAMEHSIIELAKTEKPLGFLDKIKSIFKN